MKITLPDATEKQFDSPVSPAEVARSIGPGLAKAAIGAKVNGKLADLNRPIEQDATLQILTTPKKRLPLSQQDPDALYLLRHSAAHVMAEAIQRLWPQALLAYGPPLETGFFYDIRLHTSISSDDFERIEAEMQKIVADDRPFTRYDLMPQAGMKKLKAEDNKYKLDNAQRALKGGAATLSWYVTGTLDHEPDNPAAGCCGHLAPPAARAWEDLCMGPHLPSTGHIGAFKVMSVAQSHWHGDIESDAFQRIYGTAFFHKGDLETFLQQREEAHQRDHRVVGHKLNLFVIDEQVGQGLILWKPSGAIMRQVLEDFIRRELTARGYEMVYTPHIGKIDLYKTSGHYPYYADSQYPPIRIRNRAGAEKAGSAGNDQDEQYLLKPMNCPHHIKIYASEMHSYRDLPVRLAEFGTVYRYEKSGELAGLTRVRGFTQDDAHIFCTSEQVRDEFRSTIELVQYGFKTVGFTDVSIRLAVRDPASCKYAGDPALWDRAEKELREVLEQMNVPYIEEPGEAAFYGPKVDFVVRDVIGRNWQLGTVQLDYNLPERFGIEYVGADNTTHRPVMIHRAPFGSMERFMAILIEHYAGAFPLWLAPEQIRILPVGEKFLSYGRKITQAVQQAGFRAKLDLSNERVNAKIKIAQEMKIPYMLVVGGRDQEAGTVSVRDRQRGDLGAMPLGPFIEQAKAEIGTHGQSRVEGTLTGSHG